MNKGTKQSGFTLMELMIVVAIVAILAAIAIPSYLDYTRKSYYTEVVKSSAPYKFGVAECYQLTDTLTGCSSGQNGIPAGYTGTTNQVKSIAVINGTITVIPNAANGLLESDTYVLTPAPAANKTLIWAVSGGGITKGYIS